jgi:hypothetical protein
VAHRKNELTPTLICAEPDIVTSLEIVAATITVWPAGSSLRLYFRNDVASNVKIVKDANIATASAADIRPSAAAGISTHSTAPKESFVRRVLLDIGGFPLFRGVGMVFMLHRLVFRHFRITPQTFLAAIGGRNGRLVTRHN